MSHTGPRATPGSGARANIRLPSAELIAKGNRILIRLMDRLACA
jgi:hypothetical protein